MEEDVPKKTKHKMTTNLVLPDACASLFFHSNVMQNITISVADLKPGATNMTYVYSPNGYGVAYVTLDETAYTPAAALQVLNQTLDEVCSDPGVSNWWGSWSPSFGDQPYPVSSIIVKAKDGAYLTVLDRREGHLNSNRSFMAYPGCLYRTNDAKIRMNGTSITPANLAVVHPAAFNASIRGFTRPAFTEGYAAKYSVVLAPGGASASPEFMIDVAASNLTSSMDLQKEAWLCFQKMYTNFMSKNEALPDDCKRDSKKIVWFAQWPCYTGNQKNDTQGQYCACEVQVASQTTSAASALASSPSVMVIVLLSSLMLSVFV
ncbi:hypothetical protein BJ741DRAFT_617443 [Chytriomyces cf. hyalinus JEL632]|nr:hypothetical protein BJ741DRAFT_617443 [Chytriomyces cf. hyalinus JEL632]